jgi:thiol:disulfide interchange protein DsbD
MQSDGRRSRRFALSAMYVLGLVVMYSSLGVVAALGGKMFGAWLQLPAVLAGFSLLMLVLASSMFGAFEIQPPRWIANRSQGRAGLLGAASMGLIVGIVAAPCVGPVVISLLTLVAQIGKPALGGLMFAALAFGLGFPYLALLNVLPKPGEWMVQVKKAMGFVLIAMAFYFLRPLTGDAIFKWGIVASLLIGATFLFLSRGVAGRAMRLACASLLLIAGAAFALPSKRGADVRWDSYDEKALSAASTAGKPVIIDFYADWCLPCKELDAKTFSDPAVARELNRFIRVKADLTLSDDPKTQALGKRYGILGVPTVIFLDASGQEIRGLRLNQYENAEKFLARIRQVR